MKEYELLNNILVKKPTQEQFDKIYSCKQYFTEYGKKLLDAFKINSDNEEYFDLRILNGLPQEYQNGIMNSTSHLETTLDEMLTEIKKEYVKNEVKTIQNSNNVEEIENKLDKLKGVFKRTEIHEEISLKDMALKFFNNIDSQREKKSIKTKNWLRMNRNVRYYPGDITVIAGRPGAGKTAYALSFALELVKNGNKGIFFSLEMGEEQIINRLVSQISKVKLQNIQLAGENDEKIRYDFTDAENELLTRASGKLKEYSDNLSIISGNFSSSDILNVIENRDIDFIVVDYLQLLTTNKGENRTAEITYLSMELKRIAMKKKIHIFELCQLSRAVEQRADKRPMLSDLRESGQIEQDASCVIGLYREGYYDEEADQNALESIILKNRNGMTGVIPFNFYGEIQEVLEKC